MRALPPAPRHPAEQVSPLIAPLLRLTFLTFCPQPRDAPVHRFARHHSVYSEFQASPYPSRLAANIPPNQVRHPTDRQFASGCSPPRLTATQLPSATEPWHAPTRTFTVLIRRPHGRTRVGTAHRLRRDSANGWAMLLATAKTTPSCVNRSCSSRTFFERRCESVPERSPLTGTGPLCPVCPAWNYKLAFRKCLA